MTTIQELDGFEMLKLSEKALQFAKDNVSDNNFDLIFDLKLQYLIAEQSMIQERAHLIKLLKKRDDEIESLKSQL